MEQIGRIQLWRTIGGDAIEKGAELANTYDMPGSQAPSVANERPEKKAVIRKVSSAEQQFINELLGGGEEEKTAAVGAGVVAAKFSDSPSFQGDVTIGIPHLVSVNARHKKSGVGVGVGVGLGGLDTGLNWAPGTRGESPASNPQMGKMQPHVDVTAKEPPRLVQEKKASYYALPAAERYPLDSFIQVKTAAEYFMDTYKFMPPEDRHEYCQNLTKRAAMLNIKTDPLIEKYGSDGYAPAADIDVCLNARREAMKDLDQVAVLDKLAEVRHQTPPDVFADALERIDRAAGLQDYYGGDIPDAYFTTFGKTAAETSEKTDPKDSVVVGNEYITRRQLATYLKNNVRTVGNRFGADVAAELAKNPNDIFDSLPRDQKLVIMRMANNDDNPVKQAPEG